MPRCSMYGIFSYIYPKNHPNVGKYSIHGASGMGYHHSFKWYSLYGGFLKWAYPIIQLAMMEFPWLIFTHHLEETSIWKPQWNPMGFQAWLTRWIASSRWWPQEFLLGQPRSDLWKTPEQFSFNHTLQSDWCYWLVVFRQPKNMANRRQLGWWHSQLNGKKMMFQATNQISNPETTKTIFIPSQVI